jgi:hypothetical protein
VITSVPLDGIMMSGYALGDLTNDGNADILFSARLLGDPNYNDKAYLQQGNGDGTFEMPMPLSSLDEVIPSALIDIDGDGVLDVVGWRNSVISFWRGGDNLTFASAGQVDIGNPPADSLIFAGDVDGDSNVDVVILLDRGSAIVLWGDGTLDYRRERSTAFAADYIAGLVDFDGDGVKDMELLIDGRLQFGHGVSVTTACGNAAP